MTQTALKLKATVLPGRRVEFTALSREFFGLRLVDGLVGERDGYPTLLPSDGSQPFGVGKGGTASGRQCSYPLNSSVLSWYAPTPFITERNLSINLRP